MFRRQLRQLDKKENFSFELDLLLQGDSNVIWCPKKIPSSFAFVESAIFSALNYNISNVRRYGFHVLWKYGSFKMGNNDVGNIPFERVARDMSNIGKKLGTIRQKKTFQLCYQRMIPSMCPFWFGTSVDEKVFPLNFDSRTTRKYKVHITTKCFHERIFVKQFTIQLNQKNNNKTDKHILSIKYVYRYNGTQSVTQPNCILFLHFSSLKIAFATFMFDELK